MESYKFEFFSNLHNMNVYSVTFCGDISEDNINEIFNLLKSEHKPDLKQFFMNYLISHHLKYADLVFQKEDVSDNGVRDRVKRIFYEHYDYEDNLNKYDNHYILYRHAGTWLTEDYFWKMSLVAKMTNRKCKIVYQLDEMDDDCFGLFEIIENSEDVFVKSYHSDEENYEPVINCNPKQLFNLLIHIDEINNDADAQKFAQVRR